jgi:hypothetical protein
LLLEMVLGVPAVCRAAKHVYHHCYAGCCVKFMRFKCNTYQVCMYLQWLQATWCEHLGFCCHKPTVHQQRRLPAMMRHATITCTCYCTKLQGCLQE